MERKKEGRRFLWEKKRDRLFLERKKRAGTFLEEKKGQIVFSWKNLDLNFLKKPFLGQEIIILENGDTHGLVGI